LSSLTPAPYNPRQPLDDRTRSELLASLGRWGCLQPIIVNKKTGHIVGGHQRAEALRDLGHKEVDVIVVSLSLAEEKALNIALNRIQGHWDDAKLAQILDDLVAVPDFNVELTGFSAEEVTDLAAEHLRPPVEDRDEAPESMSEPAADADAVTKPGDLIELGRHRLLCGDSTKPEDVHRVMDGRRAALMATDPRRSGVFECHEPVRGMGVRQVAPGGFCRGSKERESGRVHVHLSCGSAGNAGGDGKPV